MILTKCFAILMALSEVIVVTTRDWYPRVSQFIVNEYRGELRVDLVQVDNDFGTADMLRAVAKKIRTVGSQQDSRIKSERGLIH